MPNHCTRGEEWSWSTCYCEYGLTRIRSRDGSMGFSYRPNTRPYVLWFKSARVWLTAPKIIGLEQDSPMGDGCTRGQWVEWDMCNGLKGLDDYSPVVDVDRAAAMQWMLRNQLWEKVVSTPWHPLPKLTPSDGRW